MMDYLLKFTFKNWLTITCNSGTVDWIRNIAWYNLLYYTRVQYTHWLCCLYVARYVALRNTRATTEIEFGSVSAKHEPSALVIDFVSAAVWTSKEIWTHQMESHLVVFHIITD